MNRNLIIALAAVAGFAVFYRHRYVQFYGKPVNSCCCCDAMAELDDAAMAGFEAEFRPAP